MCDSPSPVARAAARAEEETVLRERTYAALDALRERAYAALAGSGSDSTEPALDAPLTSANLATRAGQVEATQRSRALGPLPTIQRWMRR